MSEATRPWRAFSSPATNPAETAAEPARRWVMPRWLVPLLAGLGGAGLGVAVVGLVVLAVGVTPDGGRVAAGLEPSGTANLQAPFVVAPASAAAGRSHRPVGSPT